MNIPGRLANTTLGDLLGTLFRSQISGILELTEDVGPVAGRAHSLNFHTGLIYGIQTPLGAPPLGELLLDIGVLTRSQHYELLRRLAQVPGKSTGNFLAELHWVQPDTFDRAVHQQLSDRLTALFDLRDARVTYRIARPATHSPWPSSPLPPEVFLHGKPRNRDRQATPGSPRETEAGDQHYLSTSAAARLRALMFLGLAPTCGAADIKKAFHRMVSRLHPDRYVSAPPSQQVAARKRFAQVVDAYNTLLQLDEVSQLRGAA